MDIYHERMSVRKFGPDDVSPEMVDRLLDAAIAAPSAGNCQPWHFYAVRRQALREKLCKCAYNQRFIADAPVVLVVCADPERSAVRYGDRGRTLYSIQDTAAAIENILLCAAENGLGTCWCGAFDEAAVAEAMHLPQGLRPVAVIPVGHPAGTGRRTDRRPRGEVVTLVE